MASPDNCKPGCPACARICPKSAIIFPKYEHSPIDGDEVSDSADGPAVDLEALKQGDVYARLRNRSAGPRFSPTRDEETQPAPPADLAQRLGVPPEVISAMSPDELRKICDRASECEASDCSCNLNTNDDEERATDGD